MRHDPRYYQIGILGFLLVYALLFLQLEIKPGIVLSILICAQLTQFCCTRYFHLPRFDPRSALISSLSLCLLLRTDTISIAAFAAVLAIASKFTLRWQHKHIFNPTNFALLITIHCFDSAWVSAGQWGRDIYLVFFICCFGMLVINRSRRSDISLAFLGFYATILISRALWLGDPLVIPFHQLQNAALLIFAFFMISDPMTTPNSRPGRILFAALVSLIAAYIQFVLYRNDALLYALIISCCLTPLIDRLFPADKFQWQQANTNNKPKKSPFPIHS